MVTQMDILEVGVMSEVKFVKGILVYFISVVLILCPCCRQRQCLE
jgi:hypothetical protein